MKIYCQTCKEYVLDTSDKFVIGGQYNGSMFQAPVQSRYHVDAFMFQEWVVYGDLFCPRCDQAFIINGVILTEHGLIKEGQKSLDTDFYVIHTEGEHKNQLKSAVIWSLEDSGGSEPGAKKVPSVFICDGCQAGCHSEQKNHLKGPGIDVCNSCLDDRLGKNLTQEKSEFQIDLSGPPEVGDSLSMPDHDDFAFSAGEVTTGPGTFGEQIKEARKSAKLSRAALAKSMKISTSALKSWEKDKAKPSKKNLKKLKTALGI